MRTPSHAPTPAAPALGALLLSLALCGLLLGAAAFWMLGRTTHRPSDHAAAAPAGLHAGGLDPAKILEWPEVRMTPLKDTLRLGDEMPGVDRTLVDSDSAQALRKLVRQINDHQFATDPVPSIPQHQWQERLERAVSQTRVEVPQERFLQLGYPVFLACEQGLLTLQQALDAGSLTWEQATSDPDFEAHSVYRRNCGNMAAQMHTMGLMDRHARWTSESSHLLGLLLGRMRWARLQNIYGPALEQLSKPEQQAFLVWGLGQEATPVEKTRMLEALLALDPTYPEVRARALIALERGDMAYAKALVSRYRNQSPQNPEYRALEKALRERGGAVGGGK